MISEVLSNTFGININKTDGEYVLSNTFNIIINKISEVPVSSVSIFPKNHILKTLSSVQLTETILPRNATNKDVIWSSSDNNIANVSNTGLVTGVTAGDCIITTTTVDGNKTDTCTITVIDSKPRISDVVVDITSHGSYELTYSVLGTGDNLTHKLKISNDSYSNINPTKIGNIYKYSSSGLSNGEYICSIQVVDGDNTYTTNPFKILIENPIDGIKGLLKTSKDKYDVCHGILKVVIDSIIYDGKYSSETEKTLLEESLNNYNNSLAKYNTVSQQCIDFIASKKAEDESEKVDKKYAEILLTPDGIVSKVEKTHNQINGSNGLEQRLAVAEEKITAEGITQIVQETEFIKDMDGKITKNTANISKIDQKADSISLEVSKKVGAEEVKSTIRQSSEDIKIGFNGINDRININPRSMDFTATNGNKDMLLYGGQVCIYNNNNDSFMATMGSVLKSDVNYKGTGFLLSKHSNIFTIGRDANWDDVLTNRAPNPVHYVTFNFETYQADIDMELNTNKINMRNNTLRNASAIGTDKLQTDSWYNIANQPLITYNTSLNHIDIRKTLEMNHNNVINVGSMGMTKLQTHQWYSTSNSPIITYDNSGNQINVMKTMNCNNNTIRNTSAVGTGKLQTNQWYNNNNSPIFTFNTTHNHTDCQKNLEMNYYQIKNAKMINPQSEFAMEYSSSVDVENDVDILIASESISEVSETGDVSFNQDDMIRLLYKKIHDLEKEVLDLKKCSITK